MSQAFRLSKFKIISKANAKIAKYNNKQNKNYDKASLNLDKNSTGPNNANSNLDMGIDLET